MGKQSPEEIRRQVLEEDNRKDISIYLSVPIGVVAGVSAIGALCAVIVMRALIYFRHGVDAYWLSCVPFLFPVMTGLFAAYKKQLSLLGVHLVVTLLALLLGGFGFALSVEPIFLNRHNCVSVSPDMPCEKTTLAYMYVVSGGVAAGFAVLSCLMTICGLHSASKRIATREREAEVQHLREQEEKQRELRQMKVHNETRGRTLSASSPPTSQSTSQTTAANGIPQVTNEKPSNATAAKNDDGITTKL